MGTENLTLMNALSQKMSWLDENQKYLAQNIANADTPGYRPDELKPIDFKDVLKSSTSSLSMAAASGTGLATTDPKHMTTNGIVGAGAKNKEQLQKKVYEVAPAGNAVVLEEQLMKMNTNYTDHRFITNLYQKNIDMMKEAIRSGN